MSSAEDFITPKVFARPNDKSTKRATAKLALDQKDDNPYSAAKGLFADETDPAPTDPAPTEIGRAHV